ncbi:MAG: LPS-assembly protein LptD [Gemmatimonadetes bacterium]|nr:LPS-assembly protein LptD [Gemmatimonadota bacterium]
MTVGPRAILPLLAGIAIFAVSPARMAAQEVPPPVVDSTDIRIRERLARLSRGPGVDSTLIRLDSLVNARRAAPPPQPIDSFMARLMELDGFAVTHYHGTAAHFDVAAAKIQLMGDGEANPATLTRPDMRITALDTITMDDARDLVWTHGETVTERPGEEPVTSENIVYDLDEERGSAIGARTRINQGAEWIMFGDLPGVYPDLVYGHHVTFTSCQETQPHYHFAAKETKVVGGGWLLARSVTLNFGGVPVLWLPFIFQSVDSDRSSGILFPRFGVNDIVRTSRGQTRRISNVGFYWAVNDYSDATLALDWWSDNFVSLTGNVRYNIVRQFLNGSGSYRQFWKSDGGREISFDTRHSWEMSERMAFRGSARFTSSAQFVRQNSFDPREVTGSINSEGGLNRRFDWGTLSLNANRRQFLSDDRVEMTLPSLNLSLKSITLFRAPPGNAKFYNNLTWSGSASATRSIVDREDQVLGAGEAFNLGLADQVATRASGSSSFNLGGLSWSQTMSLDERVRRDVPHSAAFPEDSLAADPQELSDISSANLSWSTSFGYQQRIIGTTTLTPSLSISGQAKQDDLNPEAQTFVSGPTRIAFGARLKSDIYGFFGGFGPFEAIRHKVSPSFTYQYAPAVDPTDLQRRVFGVSEVDARNVISMGINQTFEAKRRAPTDTAQVPGSPRGAEDAAAEPGDAEAEAPDSLGAEPDSAAFGADGGPRRAQESPIVKLLAIRTSVITYDFTKAGQEGNSSLDGFQTTRLTNSISSDFLRGLSVSMVHDLFDTDDDGDRTFSPLLSQLSMNFSMSDRSGIVQALGRLLRIGGPSGAEPGPEPDPGEAPDVDLFEEDLNEIGVTDESMIVPGRGSARPERSRRARGAIGGWQAQISYSLSRSRVESQRTNQLLDAGLRFRPTENWSASWRTSYDVEDRRFNDHVIRLTRELHRWQANFDFLQTATGNWTFRFTVSLQDNRDLKFDYEQRNNNRENQF